MGRRRIARAACSAFTVLALLGMAEGSIAAKRLPVACRVWINVDLTDQNVPMQCETATGEEFVNVPEGQYFLVTDVLVKPRLTTQTTVAASVRIWQESGGSVTGCDEFGVIGSFLRDVYLELADTSVDGQLHTAFQTPYLVLTPNDCLAVYTSTPSGLVVELSGYLSKKPYLP